MQGSRIKLAVKWVFYSSPIWIGIAVWLVHLNRLSNEYRARVDDLQAKTMVEGMKNHGQPGYGRRMAYLDKMIIKYSHAAKYPWLPLQPDPTPP